MLLRPHCEVAASEVVPAIRAAVVYCLSKEYGLSNYTIAKKIGTTASTVSHYLKDKRSKFEKVEEILKDNEAGKLVRLIAKKIAEDTATPEELGFLMCRTCRTLMRKWRKQSCLPVLSF